MKLVDRSRFRFNRYVVLWANPEFCTNLDEFLWCWRIMECHPRTQPAVLFAALTGVLSRLHVALQGRVTHNFPGRPVLRVCGSGYIWHLAGYRCCVQAGVFGVILQCRCTGCHRNSVLNTRTSWFLAVVSAYENDCKLIGIIYFKLLLYKSFYRTAAKPVGRFRLSLGNRYVFWI